MKDYLLQVLVTAAPENGFGQDAIEYAIIQGFVKLTYDLEADIKLIMGQYDKICEAFHRHQANEAMTTIHLNNPNAGVPITELTSGAHNEPRE